MRKKLILSLMIFFFTASSVVRAEDDDGDFNGPDQAPADNQDSEIPNGLHIGNVKMEGSGCPSESTDYALSPDRKVLSILFGSYIAEVGGNSGIKKTVKDCTIDIPFTAPVGIRVSVVKLDYRVFAILPDEAKSKFVVRYNLPKRGQREKFWQKEYLRPIDGVNRKAVFTGPLEMETTLSSRVRSQVWSPCGGDFNLRINTKIVSHANKRMEAAAMGLNSIDGSTSGIKYHLRWKKCKL